MKNVLGQSLESPTALSVFFSKWQPVFKITKLGQNTQYTEHTHIHKNKQVGKHVTQIPKFKFTHTHRHITIHHPSITHCSFKQKQNNSTYFLHDECCRPLRCCRWFLPFPNLLFLNLLSEAFGCGRRSSRRWAEVEARPGKQPEQPVNRNQI